MSLAVHGSRRKVANGCTCNLCTLVRESRTTRTPDRASVPITEAQMHLTTLVTKHGWTIASLAPRTGYGESTLYAIRTGRWQFVSRYIADDITSIPLEPAPGWAPGAPPRPRHDLVLVQPARDHINALITHGWSRRAIADTAGCARTTVNLIYGGTTTWTRAEIADSILAIPLAAKDAA